MSKVYAVNLSDKNYTPAEEYGELIFMTEGVLNLRKLELYEKRIRSYLVNADSDDYLLFSGHPLVCALAMKIWLEKNEKCNVLLWEFNIKSQAGRYQRYEIK